MLRLFPYGTRLRIQDLSGNHPYVNGRIFVVEDTMHARKTNQVDVWMPSRSQAMNWGVRRVRVTVVN
ncbi:3D domain-containing protein [Deinococcus radiophilus]